MGGVSTGPAHQHSDQDRGRPRQGRTRRLRRTLEGRRRPQARHARLVQPHEAALRAVLPNPSRPRGRVLPSQPPRGATARGSWDRLTSPGFSKSIEVRLSMRAIVYSHTGGPDVLRLVERSVPATAAGQVRVRVHISGVNPTDWKSRRGWLTGQRSVTGDRSACGLVKTCPSTPNWVLTGQSAFRYRDSLCKPMSGRPCPRHGVPLSRTVGAAERRTFSDEVRSCRDGATEGQKRADMTRFRNLKGPTKYFVWSLAGLALGVVYVLLTNPFFDSGPIWYPPVFGFFVGVMQAFYAGRRDRNKSNPNSPPVTRTRYSK